MRRARVVIGFVVSVAVIVACSGSDTNDAGSSACGPASCAGCCGADGRCETGIESASCGDRGGACQACAPDQACQGGSCVGGSGGGGVDGGDAATAPGLCQAKDQACGMSEQCCDGLKCVSEKCQPVDCTGDRCSAGFGAGGCCAKTPFCGIAPGARVKTCAAACIGENQGCGETSDCCAGLVCDTGFCTKAQCAGGSCSLSAPCCAGAPYCGGGSTCSASCVGEGALNGSESACCVGLANAQGGTCERYPFCAYSICTQGFAQGGCCAEAPYCTASGNLQGKVCLGICGIEGGACSADTDCCTGLGCRRGRCEAVQGTGCGEQACTAGFAAGGCCESSPVCGAAAAGTPPKCRAACVPGGGACTGDADCCGARTCTGGVCSASGKGPVGARCILNSDCTSGNGCVRGLCATGGQNCSGFYGLCRTSSDCCSGTCGASKLCEPPTSTCDTWRQPCTASSCCAGLSCSSGACEYPQQCRTTGATCSATAPCCAGLSCLGGSCKAPTQLCRSSGQPCGTTGCCPGLACSGGVCSTTGATYCRALGAACAATSPCCVGLSCVAGKCASPQTSCRGDGCSVGRAAGGCCASAPFCTSTFIGSQKQCQERCGETARACASHADCCPGLNCLQGLCRQGCQGISCRSHSDCCSTSPVCREWGTSGTYYCNSK